MAPSGVGAQQIQHFSHPQHPLHLLNVISEYKCDGCKVGSSNNGWRYRCHLCDFDLHEFCAKAPNSISHPSHPQHALVFRRTPLPPQRHCDVCGESIFGFVYSCSPCGVDVHPSCTQLPNTVVHALHPHHSLHLLSNTSFPHMCSACGQMNSLWMYACAPCNFYLHVACSKSCPTTAHPFHVLGQTSFNPNVYNGLVSNHFSNVLATSSQPFYGFPQPKKESTAQTVAKVAGKVAMGLFSSQMGFNPSNFS
eukprot:Gb_35536 [translate_table: standard]